MRLESNKKKKAVFQNAILLMLGTILSKILGFGREWVIAYKYGAGAISDAFILTNSIPTTIFVSLATAITINYIPICTECKSEKDKNYFTSNIIGIATLIMLIGTVIIEIFAENIIFIFAPGLGFETKRYAVKMLRIVVFSIFPIIYTSIFQGYSQINGNFRMTSIYGVVINLIIITMVLVSTETRFYLLSIGYIFSYVVGMVICLAEAKKNKFSFHFTIDFSDNKIKKIILLTLPLMVEDVSASLSLVVDKVLGSYLESGTISALGYAATLGNVASTMIATAIITVTYPIFSKLVVENKGEEFTSELKKYGYVLGILLAPITAFVICYSKEITIVIFEHGAFNSMSSTIVGEAMVCYAVGIIPCGIQSYYVRAFYSLKETMLPVIVKVGSLLLNIILNIALVENFKHKGIALSTSLSYLISMILLAYLFDRKFHTNICTKINRCALNSTFIALLIAGILKISIGRLVQNELVEIAISGMLFVFLSVIVFYFLGDRTLKKEIFFLIKRRKND